MGTLRRARLDGLSQAALIVLQPSGVVYEAQVGGTWCRQEAAEGLLVPFDNEPPIDSPHLALHVQLGKLLREAIGLDDEMVTTVDALLAKHRFTAGVNVDRTRVNESYEAWVYVDIRDTEESLLRGFGGCKAVLTWPNSD
jgi:hypothetical protein